VNGVMAVAAENYEVRVEFVAAPLVSAMVNV
jgi:hypothetical protein